MNSGLVDGGCERDPVSVAGRSLPWSFVVDDAKNDLTGPVLAQAGLEGSAGIGQGENFVDGRPEIAAVDEPGQLHELVAAGLDDEVDGADPARGRALVRRLLGDGYESAPRAQHGRRSLEPIAAGRVEDKIDGLDDVLEAGSRVIDHLIGSKFAGGLDVEG